MFQIFEDIHVHSYIELTKLYAHFLEGTVKPEFHYNKK